eukprot:ctg_1527.g443
MSASGRADDGRQRPGQRLPAERFLYRRGYPFLPANGSAVAMSMTGARTASPFQAGTTLANGFRSLSSEGHASGAAAESLTSSTARSPTTAAAAAATTTEGSASPLVRGLVSPPLSRGGWRGGGSVDAFPANRAARSSPSASRFTRADSPLQSLDGLALEDRWRPSRSPSGSDLHVARCTNCRRSMPEALPSLLQDPDTGDKYCGPECRWTARLARGRAGSNTALDVVAANAAAEKAPVDPPGAPAPKAEKQQPASDISSGASQRARRPRVDSNRWRRKALVQAADEARSDREAQGVYNAIFMFDSVEGHCPAGCTAIASPVVRGMRFGRRAWPPRAVRW